MRLYTRKSTILLVVFAVSAVVFYSILGRYVLEGKIDFQFYADSLTYERLYNERYFDSLLDMITLGGNYLGPMLILKIFKGNHILVLVFNILVLFASVRLIRVGNDYHWCLFVFFIFLSPITFSSLISVNKEIISILSISFLVAWLFKGRFVYLFVSVLFSFLVRWQFSVYILLVFFSMSQINPVRKRRLLYLTILLLGISFSYPFVFRYFENVNAIAMEGALTNEGSGIYSFFIELQNRGLYFLVFIPKALQAMYGLIFKVHKIFNLSDIYNNIFITLHCVVSFLMFCVIFLQKKLRLEDDLVFVAIIYCLLFAVTPIYSPRYFYPVFFLICLVLSRKTSSIQERKI